MWKICLLFLVISFSYLTAFAQSQYNFKQHGKASYYARILQGNPMANGEIYYADSMVAAHRYLPLGTEIMVTNVKNGKQVMLIIKDRGPFYASRILDVSGAAADTLGFRKRGITEVIIQAKLPQQVLDSLQHLQ